MVNQLEEAQKKILEYDIKMQMQKELAKIEETKAEAAK